MTSYHKQWPLLLLAIHFWSFTTHAATDCNAVTEISHIECESLLQLDHSTDGANWINNDGWNVTNTPCSWYGVTCENGGVTGIILYENNLQGTIPNFSELPNLQQLSLWGNQLTGSIPDFSGLPNLQVLDLDNNLLTGTILNFSGLPNLQVLQLAENQLTGTIPDFSGLPNLQVLQLGNNQLTGLIPNFSSLPNLQKVYLYSNQLKGTMPDFSGLSNLRELLLWGNQLTGTIPDFSGLPNLQTLDLDNNQLTGTIPDFSGLPDLRILQLANNQLTRQIPNFSGLPDLQIIQLADNQLIGPIPDFSGLPNLQWLYLDNNQLTGAIPDLSTLTGLEYLDLRNNSVCKNRKIDYSVWPIKQAKNDDQTTWQAQLNEFPDCVLDYNPTARLFPQIIAAGVSPTQLDLTDDHFDIIALVRPGLSPIRTVSFQDTDGPLKMAMNPAGVLLNGDELYKVTFVYERGSFDTLTFPTAWGSQPGQYNIVATAESQNSSHTYPYLMVGNFPAQTVVTKSPDPINYKLTARYAPQVIMAGYSPATLNIGDDQFDVIAVVRAGVAPLKSVILKQNQADTFSKTMTLAGELDNGDKVYKLTYTYIRGALGSPEGKNVISYTDLWGPEAIQFGIEVVDEAEQRSHKFPNIEFGNYPELEG